MFTKTAFFRACEQTIQLRPLIANGVRWGSRFTMDKKAQRGLRLTRNRVTVHSLIRTFLDSKRYPKRVNGQMHVGSILLDTIRETWFVACEMSPFLLLGFLVAGGLSVLISPETIERHLGQPGLWQVIKASLLGVPLPLCSCSVVPVSASLYKHGATKGATLSFLASTPQTGVDSIAVTWSLLGPVVTLFRIAVAFLSGILAGASMQLKHGATPQNSGTARPACDCCAGENQTPRILRALHYGFVILPRDMGRPMLLGLLISGLLTAVIPENYFADKLAPGLVSMLLMMVIGIPIYTCSSGSVPVALALIHAGVSPGAALVFLVTGPATNAATVTTIGSLLGKRAVISYLAWICICALAAGLLLDLALDPADLPALTKHIHGEEPHILKSVSAIILIGVLLQNVIRHRDRHAT
jgi:uncharacterized membrane protein YraQ (UPF0718 family)